MCVCNVQVQVYTRTHRERWPISLAPWYYMYNMCCTYAYVYFHNIRLLHLRTIAISKNLSPEANYYYYYYWPYTIHGRGRQTVNNSAIRSKSTRVPRARLMPVREDERFKIPVSPSSQWIPLRSPVRFYYNT